MLKSLNEDEGEKGVNDMTRLKFNYYIVTKFVIERRI